MALDGASWLVLAHSAGSAEFYWAIGAELLVLGWTVALLLAPRWQTSEVGGWRFRLWGLAAALVAAGVTLAGKMLEVWPGNPLFPSGHTAWAVVIAVFLVGRDWRWLPWVIPPLALLAVALVLARYHIVVDIAGGLIVGLAVGFGGLWLFRRGHGTAAAPAAHPARRPERQGAR